MLDNNMDISYDIDEKLSGVLWYQTDHLSNFFIATNSVC